MRLLNTFKAIALAASVPTFTFSNVSAQIYKGETAGVGDPVHTVFGTLPMHSAWA